MSKGNGEAWIMREKHMALSVGAVKLDRGYPCVLAVLEGNGSRPSHKGPGISTNGDTMYTLNSVEVHGVVYELPRQDRPIDGK